MNKTTTPKAKQKEFEFTLHGKTIKDEYSWLRADEWPKEIKNNEILDYLKEENKYFNETNKPLAEEKNKIFEELKGRIQLKDQSLYSKKDNYFYYTRTEAELDYPIYCRKKDSKDNQEEIILDVNQLAQGKKFLSLSALSVSPDHKLLAYSVDTNGSERYTIKILNLETKELLQENISDTIGSIVWHENIEGFFYSPTDENWRHNKILFHKLGEDTKEDKIIMHEENHLYNVSCSKSSSKDYIFLDISGHDSNEAYYIDMKDESFSTQLLRKRKDTIIYDVDHGGDYFYMHTNDEAKNFHLLRTESKNFNAENDWQTYIAEDKKKYLSGFDITKTYLLLNYRNMGLVEPVIQNLTTREFKKINFPENSYTASIFSSNYEEDDIKLGYSSLARPSTSYSYDFNTEKLSVLKEQKIPSGFNPDEYKVERIFIKTDNVEVPVSIFYKENLFKKDGSNPLYLYGYGSYGHSVPPSFRSTAVSYADRGFVFAIAHIRGGDDLGHDWYESAKFLNKKRTFSDFIACAEHLVENNYTSKGNIAIAGGSAGGMLVGNVINQRPELFKLAIAHVPFVDVLNTMLDEKLPLTPGEFKEWGNPKEKEYFEYIKSYCPYSNIKQQNYPHLFVTAGLSDPRVGYWEAAKWVARLRDQKTDDNTIIFKANMDYGHGGASGRFDYLKEIAEEMAYVFSVFKE